MGSLDRLRVPSNIEDDPYGLALRHELELLRKEDDSYLLHEYLEDINEPLYFHEFATRSAGHGLLSRRGRRARQGRA